MEFFDTELDFFETSQDMSRVLDVDERINVQIPTPVDNFVAQQQGSPGLSSCDSPAPNSSPSSSDPDSDSSANDISFSNISNLCLVGYVNLPSQTMNNTSGLGLAPASPPFTTVNSHSPVSPHSPGMTSATVTNSESLYDWDSDPFTLKQNFQALESNWKSPDHSDNDTQSSDSPVNGTDVQLSQQVEPVKENRNNNDFAEIVNDNKAVQEMPQTLSLDEFDMESLLNMLNSDPETRSAVRQIMGDETSDLGNVQLEENEGEAYMEENYTAPSPAESELCRWREIISDDDLIRVSVKELNRRLSNQPKDVQKKLKQRRRTLKNRGYAQNCRSKRVEKQEDLERVNNHLLCQLEEKDHRIRSLETENKKFLKLVHHFSKQNESLRNENALLKN